MNEAHTGIDPARRDEGVSLIIEELQCRDLRPLELMLTWIALERMMLLSIKLDSFTVYSSDGHRWFGLNRENGSFGFGWMENELVLRAHNRDGEHAGTHFLRMTRHALIVHSGSNAIVWDIDASRSGWYSHSARKGIEFIAQLLCAVG
jgi:hypothetical protein